MKAPGGLSKSTIFTLPTTDGTSGQYLKTSGAGALSFDTISSGGTPGGSDTQLQYNNGGSFGGISSASVSGGLITIGSGNKLQFVDSGEYISGNGTDLTIGSGGDINLTSTSNVNIATTKKLVLILINIVLVKHQMI